jgi:protein SCO1/2
MRTKLNHAPERRGSGFILTPRKVLAPLISPVRGLCSGLTLLRQGFGARLLSLVALIALFIIPLSPAIAAVDPQRAIQESGIDERLGNQIDLSLLFFDETGAPVTLKDVITPNRPFLLAPVYYTCPNLCNLTLTGATTLLQEIQLKLGTDFSLIAYSIKPEENPDLAAKKRENYLKELGPISGDPAAWRFLTGPESSIRALSEQIGFKYLRQEEDFAHAAALIASTPSGLVSKYLFGVVYDPVETRKVLVDASEGRIGTLGEKIFLYCFRYDHLTGKYSPVVMNLTRVVGGVVVVLLFGTLIVLRSREVLSEGGKVLG